MKASISEFKWIGSTNHLIDQINVKSMNQINIGRFGGNSSSGQYKNEDACLVWTHDQGEWEFAMILDAHDTSESAEGIMELFERERDNLVSLLSQKFNRYYFNKIESKLLELFQSEDFLTRCEQMTGESACLILIRNDKYVWWFSVGDCILYLFHKELIELNQYQLNQRQFFEWIGQNNTFNQPIPCYTRGVRELRQGVNQIMLTTDGLIECPNEPFIHSRQIFDVCADLESADALHSMLRTIQQNGVRDSTTIVTWKVNVSASATMPSDRT